MRKRLSAVLASSRQWSSDALDAVATAEKVLYFPAPRSITIAVLVTSVILLSPSLLPPFDRGAIIPNLIMIEAGLAALALPVVIFVVGLSRNQVEEGISRSEVFLRETLLFPFSILCVLTFFSLIPLRLVNSGLLGVVITGLWVILILYRIIHLSLANNVMFQKSVSLLEDKVRRLTAESIATRIANNQLAKELTDDTIPLDLGTFNVPQQGDTWINIGTDKRGVVTEVAISKLRQLAEMVEMEANRNGYSYYRDKIGSQMPIVSSSTLVSLNISIRTLQEDRQRFLTVKAGDVLTSSQNTLLSIHSVLLRDQGAVREIRKLASDAIRVRRVALDSDAIRLELGTLKDRIIELITEGKKANTDRLLGVYPRLHDIFLQELSKRGARYSLSEARAEISSIWRSWPTSDWLTEDLRDILELAIALGRAATVESILSVPLRIANQALEGREHYTFIQFIKLGLFAYQLAVTPGELSQRISNRLSLYFKTLMTYRLGGLMRASSDVSDIERLSDFSQSVLLQYKDLTKLTLDRGDKESYKTFMDDVQSFHDAFADEDTAAVRAFHFRLQHGLSGHERERLQLTVAVAQARTDADRRFNERRQEFGFAIASLALGKIFEGKEGTDQSYLTNATWPSFGDLATLTAIYLRTRAADDFWGWTWWDLIPDGKVRSINPTARFERFYAVQALRCLESHTNEQIAEISLPDDRDLAFLIGPDGDIRRIIRDLAERRPSFVSDNGLSRMAALFDLYDATIERRKRQEEDAFIAASLSQLKIEEFRSSFVDAFERASIVRSVLDRYGRIDDRTTTYRGDEPESQWGINELIDKGWFLEKTDSHYPALGPQLGRQLGFQETANLFKSICSNLKVLATTPSEMSLADLLESAANKLRRDGAPPRQIVMIAATYSSDIYSLDRHRFKQSSIALKSFEGLAGYFQGIPIFETGLHQERKVIILSMASCPKLIQYYPVPRTNPEYGQKKFLAFRVSDLNADHAARQELLDKPPEWLQKQGDKERFLRKHATISVNEKFEFEPAGPPAGVIIDLGESAL